MAYFILFMFLLSVVLFGFRRTAFFTIYLIVTLALLFVFGTAVITLLPVIIGIYIFYSLFGKRYYQKKYREQREDFGRRFRFYYYDMGGNQQQSGGGQRYTTPPYNFNTKNYYSVLGVSENASEDEVKSAYKKLARQYHPDLQSGKTEEEKKIYENKFKEINEAYDEIKKRQL